MAFPPDLKVRAWHFGGNPLAHTGTNHRTVVKLYVCSVDEDMWYFLRYAPRNTCYFCVVFFSHLFIFLFVLLLGVTVYSSANKGCEQLQFSIKSSEKRKTVFSVQLQPICFSKGGK